MLAAALVAGVATPAAAVPQGPKVSGVALSSDAPGTLDISWDEPTPAPVDYRVIWARVGESFSSWTQPDGNEYPTEASLQLTGLDEDTEYKVRVRARYDGATLRPGPWSDTATFTVAGQPALEQGSLISEPPPDATPIPPKEEEVEEEPLIAVRATAEGFLGVIGFPLVGHTLTVSTDDITDADGLTSVSYTYQWIRVAADSTEGDIAGATSSSYQPTAEDVGSTIKVKVSFTDDLNNAESLTATVDVPVTAFDETADCAATTATACSVAVGGSKTGAVSALGDVDWWSVSLEADTTYLVTVHDLRLLEISGIPVAFLYNSAGTELDQNDGFSSSGTASGLSYAVSSSGAGRYFVGVKHKGDDDFLSYRVSVYELAALDETTDCAASAATACSVEVGGPVRGDLSSSSDVDWWAVDLQAGVEYQIDVEGYQGIGGTLGDPEAVLKDTAGTVDLDSNDDRSGDSLDSRITYDVPTTGGGTYYIAVSAAVSDASGSYRVTVTATTSIPATGAPSVSGVSHVGQTLTASTDDITDADGLTMAVFSYQWVRVASDSTETDIAGATSSTYVLTEDDVGSKIKVRVSFTDDNSYSEGPLTSETAFPFNGSVRAAVDETADCAASAATACSVAVGGSKTGIVSPAGDVDWWSVGLDADTTYLFTVYAVADDAGDYGDPEAFLYDSGGTELASNDDLVAAAEFDSGFSHAVSSTGAGTYYVGVKHAFDNAEFSYRVSVHVLGSLDETTDCAASTATVCSVAPGGQMRGELSPGGDVDWWSVDLLAGGEYQIDVEGFFGSGGTLADPSAILKDTAGSADLAESNDVGGSNVDSRITYDVPTTDGGTYYITVSDGLDDDLTGSYRVTVTVTASPAARGAPTVSGLAHVGETLTASTEDITDADGLTMAVFSYQWVRVASDSTETDIAGATSSTYVLTEDDVGSKIKVRVSFSDDGGYSEGPLPSEAFPSVESVRPVLDETADCAASAATACSVAVGGSKTGIVSPAGDVDWWSVGLDADKTYLVVVSGIGVGPMDPHDPTATLYGSTGTQLVQNGDVASGVVLDSALSYGVPSSGAGTYYIGVKHSSNTGQFPYQVSVYEVGPLDETTDCAATTATACSAVVGGSVRGDLSTSTDGDWWSVELTAGVEYQIDVEGYGSGGGTLADPLAILKDTAGTTDLIEADDRSDNSLDSRITYVVPTTDGGKYYIAVSDALAGHAGSYRVTVTPVSVNFPAVGKPQIFGFTFVGRPLTAGPGFISDQNGMTRALLSYQWVRVAPGGAETDIDGATSSSYVLTAEDLGSTIKVRVTFADDAGNSEGPLTSFAYGPAVQPALDEGADCAASTGTACSVTVGGQVTGVVMPVGDVDWWSVSLEADKTYLIAVGFVEFGGSSSDPAGILFDPMGVELLRNDDFYPGEKVNSGLSYTVPSMGTGTYFIGVKHSSNSRPLLYRVSVFELAALDETADCAASTATACSAAVDDSVRGEITPVTDVDWWSVELKAGVRYQIDVEGYESGGGSLPNPAMVLKDAAGTSDLAENDYRDDGDGLDARITYEVPTDGGGKYFIAVKPAFSDDPAGSYTVTVTSRSGTPATGAPSISGLAYVSQTLTASTDGISDDDGLTMAVFSYQWVRVYPVGEETDITGATSSTYVPTTEDLGSRLKVRVSLTDDGGNSEGPFVSETAFPETDSVRAALDESADCAATTATGCTLALGDSKTGSITPVGDADWWSVSLEADKTYLVVVRGMTSESAVSADPAAKLFGSTASQLAENGDVASGVVLDAAFSYAVPAMGAGTYYIEVKSGVADELLVYQVSILEIAPLDETADCAMTTSTACDAVVGGSVRGQLLSGTDSDWWAVPLLAGVEYQIDVEGYQGGGGTLADPLAVLKDTAGTADLVEADDHAGTRDARITYIVPDTDAGKYYIAVSDALTGHSGSYRVTVTASHAARGAPSISGVAQVGSTLTASTDGIVDPDGLTMAVFSYQWVRVAADSTETEIAGATSATYLLTDTDAGFKIRVRVSFSDDAGHSEGPLTSEALPSVGFVKPVLDETADCAESTATACSVEVGASATGAVDPFTDADWWSVELKADTTYVFTVLEIMNAGGFDGDPEAFLYDSSGTELDSNDDFLVTADVLDSQITYTVSTTGAGTYYIGVEDALDAGQFLYRVWVAELEPLDEETDCGAAVTTVCVILVGESLPAEISPTDDDDWWRVKLEAGLEYEIEVGGFDSGDGTLTHPRVTLKDTAGTVDLATKRGTPTNRNPLITYDVPASDGGTYYISVEDIHRFYTGTYKLKVRITTSTAARGSPSIFGSAHAGETLTAFPGDIIDENGTAGALYSYHWIRVAADGTETDIAGATSATFALTAADVGSRFKVRATFADDLGNSEGPLTSAEAYPLYGSVRAAVSETPECLATTATACSIAVGGTVTAEVSPDGDVDWWSVRLGGDKTYLFTVISTGAPTGRFTGPVVVVFDSAGTELVDSEEHPLEFLSHTVQTYTTPPRSGMHTYYIGVRSFTESPLFLARYETSFSYVLSVVEVAPLGEKDDCAASTSTECKAVLGIPVRGELDAGDDGDWWAVDLLAGGEYQIDVDGYLYDGGTITDAIAILKDKTGTTDLAQSNGGLVEGHDARITYDLPDTDVGTYYISVIHYGGYPGSYTVTVRSPEPIAAEGRPQILGFTFVGQTLTTATDDITDANGLSMTSFSYQWVRVAPGGAETDIDGATSSSYVLTAEDLGSTIKVTVTFADDGGNSEGPLTSFAYGPAVQPALDEGADCAASTGTACSVTVGGQVTGVVTPVGDVDWWSVSLEADKTYLIAVGFVEFGGSSSDPAGILFDPMGVELLRNDDFYPNEKVNSGLSYTVPSMGTGTYFIGVKHSSNSRPLLYRVSVFELAALDETADCAASTATACSAAVDDSVRGEITPVTDVDWWSVELKAGVRYQIDVEGYESGGGSLPNPAMVLKDAAGTSDLAENDYRDDGDGLDARITYEVPTDGGGKYFIAVKPAFSDDPAGSYTVTVTSRSGTPATGAPSISGLAYVSQTLTASTDGISDDDGLTMAVFSYQWVRVYPVGEETDITGATSSTYVPTTEDLGSRLKVRVSLTDDGGNSEGPFVSETAFPETDSVRAALDESADCAATTATGCTLALGDSKTGSITPVGDADWWSVSLEADKTYLVVVRGMTSESAVSADPAAKLFGSTASQLAENGDVASGVVLDAAFSYAVPAMGAGTYYIEVKSGVADELLVYQVSILEIAPLDETADCAMTTSTACDAVVGGSVRGQLLSGTDSDWWAVPLLAGVEYQIDVEGYQGGGGTLADPLAVLKDTAGTADLVEADDHAGTRDARITYIVPDTDAGKYYIAVSDALTGHSGSYRVTVTANPQTTSNANLSGLAVTSAVDGSPLSLVEPFAETTTAYTLPVGNEIEEITVAATTAHPSAMLGFADEVGNALDDADGDKQGRQFRLDVGTNTIRIVVTAVDTTAQTYTLTVTRAASTDARLSALVLRDSSDGADADTSDDEVIDLSPAFDLVELDYTAKVAHGVTKITVEATSRNPQAKVLITSDGVGDVAASTSDADPVKDGYQVALPVGGLPIRIQVTAENPSFSEDFSVTVVRAGTDEADDCAADESTGCAIGVGESKGGVLDSGTDMDWWSVDLKANATYQIDVARGPGNWLASASGRLYPSADTATSVADDETSGPNGLPQFDHTVPADMGGVHYIEVHHGTGTGTVGSYSLTVTEMDIIAPSVDEASVTGATLTLTFDEPLDSAFGPVGSAFTVEVNGGLSNSANGGSEVAVRAASAPDSVTVVLSLASAVPADDAVTVSYAKPASDGLRDAAGNEVAGFDDVVVDNLTPRETVAPSLLDDGVVVRGVLVVLSFDEPLDEGSVPGVGAFVVRVGGAVAAVDSVDVDDSRVVLVLASAVAASDSVTVLYTAPPSDVVRDVAGNPAESFGSPRKAENLSGQLPALSVGDVTVTESTASEGAESVFAVLTVTASGPVDQAVTVNWEASSRPGDTAAAGTDYAAGAGTVTIPRGVSEASIRVEVMHDRVFEAPETFTVSLTGAHPAGAVRIADAAATVTILNVAPRLALAVFDAGLDESVPGSGGQIARVWAVDTGDAFAQPQTVEFTFGGSAAEGVDYEITSPVTVTVPSGETGSSSQRTVQAAVLGDRIHEGAETIEVFARVGGTPVRLDSVDRVVEIEDDDDAPVPVVSADRDDVVEASGDTVTVTVSTGTGSTYTTAKTVLFTLTGTAERNRDFEVSSVDLVQQLPAGEGDAVSQVSLEIEILDDTLEEGAETVTVAVSVGGTAAGSVRIAISDDETNQAATGAPSVRGWAKAGRTLWADTSAVGDPDGLSVRAFSYQWQREASGGAPEAIPGATRRTYRVAPADTGRLLRVQVSFSDDLSNRESTVSPWTREVWGPGLFESPTRTHFPVYHQDSVAPGGSLSADAVMDPRRRSGSGLHRLVRLQTGVTYQLGVCSSQAGVWLNGVYARKRTTGALHYVSSGDDSPLEGLHRQGIEDLLFTPAQTADYAVSLSGFPDWGRTRFEYRLRLRVADTDDDYRDRPDTAVAALPATSGGYAGGGLIGRLGDTDWVRVTVAAAGVYRVTVTADTGHADAEALHDPRIAGVYDAASGRVGDGDDSGGPGRAASTTFTAPAAGDYWIAVRSPYDPSEPTAAHDPTCEGHTGAYTVAVAPAADSDNSPWTTSRRVGTAHSGGSVDVGRRAPFTVEGPGDTAWIKVALTHNHIYQVKVAKGSHSGAGDDPEPDLLVYRPRWRDGSFSDTTAPAICRTDSRRRMVFRADHDGQGAPLLRDYWIRVKTYDDTGYTTGTVTVTKLDTNGDDADDYRDHCDPPRQETPTPWWWYWWY